MGIVGCPLLELGGQLQCPRVQARRVVQFKPGPKQVCNHPRAVRHSQIPAHYPSVKDVGDLERQKVRGDAGYVLDIP